VGAVTPIYALPYPVGTDLIIDGDNAIQALAQRVEALLGTAIGAPSGRRNVIRNGDMGVAQRGNGPFTAAGPQLDGWRTQQGGGTVTVNRVALPVGPFPAWQQSIVVAGQAAAGDYAIATAPIESVRTLAGQQVTLSFLASSPTATPKIAVEIEQSFGTGGAPSAIAQLAVGLIPIGAALTRYVVTFTVPSIVGKLLGTNGDDSLRVNFWLSAGSTYAARSSGIGIQNATVNITDVQLEAGAVATPFERLSPQQQWSWALRYYVGYEGAINGFISMALYGGSAHGSIFLPGPMRASPTPSGGGLYIRGNSNDAAFTLTGVTPWGPGGNAICLSGSGAFTNATSGTLWGNSATSFIRLTAEL
jgi:hypothetical protein